MYKGNADQRGLGLLYLLQRCEGGLLQITSGLLPQQFALLLLEQQQGTPEAAYSWGGGYDELACAGQRADGSFQRTTSDK